VKPTVLVGLSGGVDSTVAAALLKEQGYHVIGVTMSVWSGPAGSANGPGACYGPDEKEELILASQLAEQLGIEHHIVHIADIYESIVIKHFKEKYAEGKTPNPCVVCNSRIKFKAMVEACVRSGIKFDYFATGHYARIKEENGEFRLQEATDRLKDQTYFLYRIDPDYLSKILFPLGTMTKDQVRIAAKERNLPVHDTPDSKGFYSGNYRELLGFEDRPGNLVDKEGNILGTHKGIWNFTIGQKKGLGLPGATEGKPTPFVIAVRAATDEVVIGTKEDLLGRKFSVTDLNWLYKKEDVRMIAENHEYNLEIKVSNTMARSAGRISKFSDTLIEVEFFLPQIAIAPGQSAVIYYKDTVLGGGFIQEIL
jgi:tRNA-uridine 2-sulfurtransferase